MMNKSFATIALLLVAAVYQATGFGSSPMLGGERSGEDLAQFQTQCFQMKDKFTRGAACDRVTQDSSDAVYWCTKFHNTGCDDCTCDSTSCSCTCAQPDSPTQCFQLSLGCAARIKRFAAQGKTGSPHTKVGKSCQLFTSLCCDAGNEYSESWVPWIEEEEVGAQGDCVAANGDAVTIGNSETIANDVFGFAGGECKDTPRTRTRTCNADEKDATQGVWGAFGAFSTVDLCTMCSTEDGTHCCMDEYTDNSNAALPGDVLAGRVGKCDTLQTDCAAQMNYKSCTDDFDSCAPECKTFMLECGYTGTGGCSF